MNKKIIIYALVFLCAAGLIAVVVLLFQKSPAPQPGTQVISIPDVYVLSVTEYNGQLAYSETQNNATIQLVETSFANYGVVSFNNPRDIMSVACVQGYVFGNPTSTTVNQVSAVTATIASIDITVGKQNNLTFTCSKKIINNDNSQ